MGESIDSFFENVLLKNIDEDTLINVDLSEASEKTLYSLWEHRLFQEQNGISIRFMMRQWKVN